MNESEDYRMEQGYSRLMRVGFSALMGTCRTVHIGVKFLGRMSIPTSTSPRSFSHSSPGGCVEVGGKWGVVSGVRVGYYIV